jgi:hypothetical protein
MAADLEILYEGVKILYPGFNIQLKKEQKEILQLLVRDKKSVFRVLPTGYGKSLLYTLPPLLLDQVQAYNNCSYRTGFIFFSVYCVIELICGGFMKLC